MRTRWVGYVIRVVLAAALTAGAVTVHLSQREAAAAHAREVEALLLDRAPERTDAVVMTAERSTSTALRGTRLRETTAVTGVVRTQDGRDLEFRHTLPHAAAPSFDELRDVRVVTSSDAPGLWLLTDVGGAVTNASDVASEGSGAAPLWLGVAGLGGVLLLGALRAVPRPRKAVRADAGPTSGGASSDRAAGRRAVGEAGRAAD
ncbi:hypothetical protein GXB85_10000 [Cellulomonas sp. APG4]|uniref:hypothetical protein n=1 Tax=Cellulomonas sp. APG4 TaxID=1538656 RepID=UPI00137A08AF|nr:hypothetical protein [Cellulomonas sp. APG4]NCT91281.1 hypothetical protein [Cellulomonas sp. APG4]